jgi:hypothetical protein
MTLTKDRPVLSSERAPHMERTVTVKQGRAIAQAVSRWLPIAAARVWSSGICGGQNGTGAGFLRVLRFPLPFIPPNSPSSQSPGASTLGQKWPTCRVDPVWITPPTKRIATVKQELISSHEPQMGLDTKTDRLTDRQSQCNFDL